MKRSRMVLLVPAILSLALLHSADLPADPVATSDSGSSPADGARFEALAARYRQILQRRPRRGTAFDLWYRHYFDAGRLDELVTSVENAARERPNDAAAQLLLGLVLERQGRDDDAIAAYGDAEKLAAEDYYPPYVQGTLLVRKNEFDAAAQALARSLSLKPPRSEALEIAKALGRVQFRRGKTDDALKTWSDVAAQFPGDRQILEELARLLAQEEQYDEAIRRWEQIAALVRDDPADRLQTQIEIAQLHAEKGARRTAVEMFGEALAGLRPESWQEQDVRNRIEDVFLRDEDVTGLIQWCEGQLQSRPEDLDAMLQLARAQGMAGRRDEALQTYERAVRLAPSRKEIREALIAELVRKRDFAQALTHGEELAKQHPGDADALRRLGELHLEAAAPEGRAEAEQKAVEVWRRIAAIRPEDPTLALQTAEACRRAAGARWLSDDSPSPLLETAEQFYREAVRRASGAPHYHEYLGEFLHEQGRREEAVRAWSKIAAPPNDTAENWHRLAEVYARFEHLDEALQAGRRSLELDPRNFRFCNDQIGLLLQAKQFDEALQRVAELQRLADDATREEQARARAVEVYAASGRLAEKVAELRRHVDGGQGTDEDHLLLALLLIEQRAVGPARETVADALRSSPDDVRFLRLHAELLRESGDRPGAVEAYSRLAQLDPTRRAEHYAQLVQLELDLGRPAAAKAAADRLVELSPSSLEAYRLRAHVAFETNDPADGLAALRRALQVAPRDLDIRFELARALLEHKQPGEAVEHYWRCFELAESLDAKRSVVGAMADLPEAVLSGSDLIARLEQLRRRQQDSKVLTLCLVEAHRRSRRFIPARQELVKLLEERRDDPDALRQLVEIAREQHKWSDAVTWQKRIVELAPEPRELEQLASLYAQGADPPRALDIWLRLLSEHGEERPLIDAIDRRLSSGEFSTAATLAERALQIAPGVWRLHHRAGYARYALKQWEPAIEHFQQVRALIEPPHEPVNPVSQLRTAAQARSAFLQLVRFADERNRSQSARGATAAQRAVQRQRYPPPTLSDDPVTARLETLVALYLLAEACRQLDAWMEQGRTAARAHPQVARDMLLALFAANRLATPAAAETTDQLAEILSDDRLLHVARLLQPHNPATTGRLSPADRQKARDELRASFRWIAEHDPDLKREVLFSYGTSMNALGYSEITADLLLEELRATHDLHGLDPVLELALVTHHSGFREQFTLGAAELVTSSETPADAATLRVLLDIAIMRGAISRNAINDELARAAILLLERYLSASLSGSQAGRPQIVRSAAAFGGSPTPVMVSRSGTITGGVHVSGSLRQAQLLLGYHRQQQQMLTQMKSRTGSKLSAAQVRSIEEQQKRMLQQLTSLGFGENPEELLLEFPAAGAGIDAESFLALYRLRLWLAQAGKEDLLLERLAERKGEGPRQQQAFRLARAFVLWWGDRREDAVEIVRDLAESAPADTDLRLMLARACSADGRPQEALEVLDSIDNPSRSLAGEIREFKADAARRITESARLAVLRGHEHVIRALASAPDGQVLASASYDGTVRLWDPNQSQPVATLAGHREFIFCIAFSPDGKTLASAGLDGRILLWDVEKRERLARLSGHEAGVRALDFSPDGKRLLSASDDATVRLWDVASRAEVGRLAEHPEAVLCAAFSPDGKSVATGAADKIVRIHDLETGAVRPFPAHDAVVRAVAFSPDGRLLATGGVDNMVRIYEHADQKLRVEFVHHSDTVFDLAFSPDGTKLASASGDHSICLFDVARGRQCSKLTGHSNAVSSVRFLPDGRLASGSYDRTLRIWKIE